MGWSSAHADTFSNVCTKAYSPQIVTPRRSMDTNVLSRADGRSKLLFQALLSGASALPRALSVFQRQQRSSDSLRSPHRWLELLCEDDVLSGNDGQPLTIKPTVCLLPVAFKQNLLSFIHMVHAALPRTSVLRLLTCLSQEPCPNSWVFTLVRQLQRDLGDSWEGPLYTPQCSQKLRGLCEGLGGPGRTGGWAICFAGHTVPAFQAGVETSGPGAQRKRKGSSVAIDSDAEENEQQRKRIKMVSSPPVTVCSGEGPVLVKTQEPLEEATNGATVEPLQLAAVDLCDTLPEHVMAAVPRIKELLESEMEWEQTSADVFKVLNECGPVQVEVLCSMLSLSEAPEQTLPHLCSCLLGLSTDLSHSTAATIIKSLLLGKVLSLSEPASRCLVTAVISLCGRYPRPTCHALIGPVLEEGRTGSPQAELLNRLIGDCLDPHYRLLVFQMTFKGAWSEGVLSVIHSLLDAKLELNEELFTLFTKQLVSQAPQFTKSMKFSKMMLNVFTKYNSHVTAAHKHSLSCCLTSNETFLKKSLQAALKRITHT